LVLEKELCLGGKTDKIGAGKIGITVRIAIGLGIVVLVAGGDGNNMLSIFKIKTGGQFKKLVSVVQIGARIFVIIFFGVGIEALKAEIRAEMILVIGSQMKGSGKPLAAVFAFKEPERYFEDITGSGPPGTGRQIDGQIIELAVVGISLIV